MKIITSSPDSYNQQKLFIGTGHSVLPTKTSIYKMNLNGKWNGISMKTYTISDTVSLELNEVRNHNS